jgi:leucyl aminopeptidase
MPCSACVSVDIKGSSNVMKLAAVSGAPEARAADLLACGVFVDAPPAKPASRTRSAAVAKKVPASVPPGLQALDIALGGVLGNTMSAEGFTGAVGQTLVLHTHDKLAASRILLVGLGAADKTGPDTIRRFAGQVVKIAEKLKCKTVTAVIPDTDRVRLDVAVEAAAEGALLASYRFTKYLTKDTSAPSIQLFELAIRGRSKVDAAIARAQAIADGVCLARDLVNEPPASLTPVEFARRAQAAGKFAGFKVTVLDEKAIAREKMGLVLAVAAAAMPYTPPRVVRLEYRPKGKAKKHICLVGKGLTFDSGGLDIKPADGMLDMKIDMAGAAAVLGAMQAIARIKPDVAVTGYLGCVENGIGGNAFHPSDIITSRKGLTVEINNTDAEGRLVLADCIDLALTQQKPDLLIDLATLTGASMIALGPTTAAVFTDDDTLAADIQTIGKRCGEDFWRLPLNDDLIGQLKSPIADTKNTGTRMGGAITAALFLKMFVDGRANWAHIDLAGPASSDKDGDYQPRGGTGFAVRTLVGLIDPR